MHAPDPVSLQELLPLRGCSVHTRRRWQTDRGKREFLRRQHSHCRYMLDDNKRMVYLQQLRDVFRQDFSFAQPYSTVFFSKLGSICMGCKSTKCIHVYLTTALGHVMSIAR